MTVDTQPIKTKRHETHKSKKIRVHPENEVQWFDLVNISRRAYNLAIEAFKNGDQIDDVDLKRSIRTFIAKEAEINGQTFSGTACDEAVMCAVRSRDNHILKLKRDQKSSLQFRSRKNVAQSFVIQAMSKTGQPLPKILGSTFLTEEAPDDIERKTATVKWERGRWFITYHEKVELPKGEIQASRKSIVALDPGVRTFLTTHDGQKCFKLGDDFQAKLEPLFERIDKLKSVKSRTQSALDSKHKFETLRCLTKKLWKAENRICDMVDDLHRRCSRFLVDNYDIILIPTFRVSEMLNRNGRKLSRKVCRRFGRLAHFKFKTFLKWMARKTGKIVIEVDESYTSKTRSWDGVVMQIGGAKAISDGTITVDRDLNGARGILLRSLTRADQALAVSHETA